MESESCERIFLFSGVCDCISSYVPFSASSPDGSSFSLDCFPEFLRGPCAPGEQLEDVGEDDDVEANRAGTACVPTNCESEDEVRENITFLSSLLLRTVIRVLLA